MNIPYVSIVVPVYNVERYLERCIDSILAQTYTNFELILVDDGSPDNSGAICDRYAEQDTRVSVIHQENGGVSKARNAGIERAQGKYLIFVDSDDWIEKNHIELLLPIDGEDLVYGGRKVYKNGKFNQLLAVPSTVITQDEWMQGYHNIHEKGLSLTFITGCYNMQLIRNNNLRFNTELDISEDGLFNLEFMKICKRIRYSDTCTYCYEDGDSTSTSLSNKYQSKRLLAERIKCIKTEELTGLKEYSIRWYLWTGVIRHYRKWLTFNNYVKNQESNIKLKETYADPYFRECIPYIRRHGTLDQKIETFFMSVWAHPLYQPIYSIIVALSKLKHTVLKR